MHPDLCLHSPYLIVERRADTALLPVAHTCFRTLDVPDYPSKTVLREKLVTAIATQEFGARNPCCSRSFWLCCGSQAWPRAWTTYYLRTVVCAFHSDELSCCCIGLACVFVLLSEIHLPGFPAFVRLCCIFCCARVPGAPVQF